MENPGIVNKKKSCMKKCVATKFSAAMDEEQSKKNKKKKEVENIRKIAADSLKELVVLEQQNGHQPLRRSGNTVTTNKEAHPRAVLSTKLSTDDSASPPQGIETVPSSSTTPSPQVIRSSNCTVSRQISSPVDLPPSSARARSSIEQRDFEDYLVIDKVQPQSRPANLVLKRESSSTSVSTPRQELCSCLPSPGLVSSYPPGPTVSRVQSCNCSARQPVRSLVSQLYVAS